MKLFLISCFLLITICLVESSLFPAQCSEKGGQCYDDTQCCQGHCYLNKCYNRGNNCDLMRCRGGTNCIEMETECEESPCKTRSTCVRQYNQRAPCPTCGPGEVCKLTVVNCVVAPCPPIPECVPIKDDCKDCQNGQICLLENALVKCSIPNCPLPPPMWVCVDQ